MPEPHDPHQPTAEMPVVEPRGVYRAVHHRRTALIAAACAAVALVVLAVWLFSGDDEPAPRAPAAAPTVDSTTTAAPTVDFAPTVDAAPRLNSAPAAAPTEATPSPSETAESEAPSPTTAPTRRPAQPAELIAALAAVVDSLEDREQLDDDDADALNRRLEQAANRLARGDAKGASRKIDDFTRKLRDLREDDDLSDEAFNLLNGGAGQLGALLPRR
ncbi:hypothetical protein QLQ12_25170 [Actinoplanes sp. NEAU-A12]|uniref:FIMAH domain-containing protein n=1 Tax=Actinoplanes sandaracinus TaxID=3045177 RepID=A0ABT6WQ88_9ACTN|nr:hypothetical protein [Actinoplanes sandaracinus]MDI6101913.1 hypothetical protein [Actinoplanes sandaracinus]